MKKILYLIPLFLLFLIPKAYALPDCSLISNAQLYDVNSATNVSPISTTKFTEVGFPFLCNTAYDATAVSDASQGLGWNIELTTLNRKNTFYQLDVYIHLDGTGSPAIRKSPFNSANIAISTDSGAVNWASGAFNISNRNLGLTTYYESGSGGFTYYVLSYIFKANIDFNKIFVPFATSFLWTGGYQLAGINLVNTGESSLSSEQIDNLLIQQTDNIKNDITNSENNVINSINGVEENINNTINDNFNSCRDSYNLINFNTLTTNTSNGITYTPHFTNGYLDYILVKGTSTATSFYIMKSGLNLTSSDILIAGTRNNVSFQLEDTDGKRYSSSVPAGVTINSAILRVPANTTVNTYIYPMVHKVGTSSAYEPYGKEVCKNKIDETNDSINNLNDSINNSDSTGATGTAGGFFQNFEDNDFGLSGIITAPLNTIKTITSNSCTPLNLTIPFVNKEMSLPCMTDIYEEHFGSFLDIYQIITFGIISYWVCVQIYAMVKGFKNPEKDEIEVMDL